MATHTSNYGWTKPSGSDNVDISVLNNNLDDQDSTIHDAFLNMAPPFSESSTYAVDDIVLYGTGLYKCHTAVVTPGSWTGSTNWQVYKLSEGGSGGGGTSNYNQLTNKPQINHVELSGNKTAAQLGLMASDGVVANPTGQTTGTLTTLEVDGTKYAVGGGSSLEAGDYIDITEGVISVKKEKGEYSLERYVLQSTGGGAPKLVVKKYIDSELISTNEYANNTAHVNIDDTLEIWYSYNPYNWHYKLLVDGVDHSAGYEYEFSYTDTTEYPVDFHISAGDSTDLVTKGDLTAENILMSDGVTSVEDALPKVTDWYTIPNDITVTSSGWANIASLTVFGLTSADANRIINIQLGNQSSTQKPFMLEAASNGINGVFGGTGTILKNQKIRLIYI